MRRARRRLSGWPCRPREVSTTGRSTRCRSSTGVRCSDYRERKPTKEAKIVFRRRVSLVLQETTLDCGAACLAMVARFHGIETGLRETGRLLAGRTDAYSLLQAADRMGLDGRGYQTSPEGLEGMPVPFIAHWRGNHFVVVEKVTKDALHIVDPAEGRCLASRDAEEFGGAILTFTRAVAGRERRRLNFQWVGPIVDLFAAVSMRGLVTLIALIGVALLGVGLVLPFLTKVAIDRIAGERQASLFVPLLALFAAIAGIYALLTYLRAAMGSLLRAKVDPVLYDSIFGRLVGLKLDYFRQRSAGDVVSRINSVEQIRDTVTTEVAGIGVDAIFFLIYLGVLGVQSRLYMAIALVLAVLQAAIPYLSLNLVVDRRHASIKSQAATQSFLFQTMNEMTTIKACGLEGVKRQELRKRIETQVTDAFLEREVSNRLDSWTTTMGLAAPTLLLLSAVYLTVSGTASLGESLAMSVLATALLTSLTALIGSARRVHLLRIYGERMLAIYTAEEERTGDGLKIEPGGRVEVDGLTCFYPGRDRPALDGVSLAVGHREAIAIVGPTGCGKSTLILALLGLIDPARGTIRYNGIDIADLDPQYLRSRIGVVLQDSVLFSGTIRENISQGRPGGEEEIERAARLAEIYDDVMAMPMRFDEVLNEGGKNLSGGQRQRLALARALFGSPILLILDEATSHLDPETESRITANLKAMDCTRIIVSHRLASTHNLDRIYMMRDGSLVEQGTHTELLERDVTYRTQFELASPSRN
ncbi:peptidase domain-containing ABC transporter [bacterium]|nr:MAG: peptidase domain-containing ABC transporter [bacterium]